MKLNLSIFLLSGCLILISCNQRKKEIEKLNVMQMEVDSIMSTAEVLNAEQKTQTTKLINAYLNYADKHDEDSLSAEYMFEAARLKTRLPDYAGAIQIYNSIADKFPESHLAPKSLLAAAGIYDVTLEDYANAQIAYLKLKEKYPVQAQRYGVDMALNNLGKSAEEILDDIMKKRGDTIFTESLSDSI